MSLLSDDKKFIFFHLYKCGGNSLRRVLNDLVPNTYEWEGVHGLPADVKTHFEKNRSLEEFDEFFKFTFIRNPFDFMVSTYFYGKTFKNHFMHHEIVSRNMEMHNFIPYYMNVRIQHTDPTVRPFGSNKVVTIKDWLMDEGHKGGVEIMDYVGKLETVNEDMKVIFDKLGLAPTAIPLVNVNQNRVPNYQQYYNDESRAMIEKYFAWELEKFNYTF